MNAETESRYARKVKRRKQMYGPGCCAHDRKVPPHPRRFRDKEGRLVAFWWMDQDHVRRLGL